MAVMRTHGRAVQFGENGEDFFQEPRIIRGGGIPRDVVDSITNAFGSEGTENQAAAALQEMIEERGGALTPTNTRRGRAFSRNVTDPDTLVDGISTSAPGTYTPGLYGDTTPSKPKGNLQVGRHNTGGIGQLQTILTGKGAQTRSQAALTAKGPAQRPPGESVNTGSNTNVDPNSPEAIRRRQIERANQLRELGLPTYKINQLTEPFSTRGRFVRNRILF